MRDYFKYLEWGDKQLRFICECHEQTQQVGKDVWAGTQHYMAILLKLSFLSKCLAFVSIADIKGGT
jgi:hypothetical protein